MSSERVILHSDMNNFYASVECRYHPELRGRPMAVCGNPELRHGIVLAKNEEAKRFGIQTGEPIWQAVRKCPEIVFAEPHYDLYTAYSKMAKEIYKGYTDQVESFGLDECWLDVSGSTKLFGKGKVIAEEIRKKIRAELGVTVSVGVSFNKIFAKLGSDLKKPDAVTEIDKEDVKARIWPMPVGSLLYVGSSTRNKLAKYGIFTIGELALSKVEFLRYILGKSGVMLWNFANGYDLSPVSAAGMKRQIKSIGNSTTTPRDLTCEEDVKITLYLLCETVAARLRKQDFVCGTVQLSLRDCELFKYERQGGLQIPSANAKDLFQKVFSLYREAKVARPLRSLGVRACGLSEREYVQLSLLPEEQKMHRQDRLERAVEHVRDRYGQNSIQRGIMYTDPSLSRLNSDDDRFTNSYGFQRLQESAGNQICDVLY